MKFRVVSLIILLSGIAFWNPPAISMMEDIPTSSSPVRIHKETVTEQNFSVNSLALAYNRHRKLGNKAESEDLISYLLTTQGYKEWGKLLKQEQTSITEKIVTKAHKLAIEAQKREIGDDLQNIAKIYTLLRKSGNAAPDTELISYILRDVWKGWDPENKPWAINTVKTEVQKSELVEFIAARNVPAIYASLRKSGNNASDSELVGYLLKEMWNTIEPENKKLAISKVTGKHIGEEERLPSVAPRLDAPFVEEVSILGEFFKTLPSKTPSPYDGRSNIYAELGATYPKVPMIHSYHPTVVSPPFAAIFSADEVSVPSLLRRYLDPKRQQTFFLNIQPMEKTKVHSFKPHYAIYPDVPSKSKMTLETPVEWTVVPGAEGRVLPESGDKDDLWREEAIWVHPQGGETLINLEEIKDNKEKERVLSLMKTKGITPDSKGFVNMDEIDGISDTMILSGDAMHLRGITRNKSVDFYSYAEAEGESFFTYHWVLTPADFATFSGELEHSHSLRELIKSLDGRGEFKNILGELKKYVGYAGENINKKGK